METKPAYLHLQHTGELEERAKNLKERLKSCDLCPRNCGVNRLEGETGVCGVGRRAWVTSHGPHYGEENPLRGWKGSGTIFFSGCNLNCLYCQNADISQRLSGVKTSPETLANMMLELENRGCHNINLVSPTHVAAQILLAVAHAVELGLRLPLVYNTGGYDSISTLKMLDGIVDIYMPDMKYNNAEIGKKYSGIPEYPRINQEAVLEMHRQVGDLELDSRGVAVRGLLIRHLVLPGNLAGSKGILEFLADKVSPNTYINIMDQYRPAYQAYRHPELNRRITEMEYQEVLDLAKGLGLKRLDQR
jgi:putative pyruvate formate lyase activating enzyme